MFFWIIITKHGPTAQPDSYAYTNYWNIVSNYWLATMAMDAIAVGSHLDYFGWWWFGQPTEKKNGQIHNTLRLNENVHFFIEWVNWVWTLFFFHTVLTALLSNNNFELDGTICPWRFHPNRWQPNPFLLLLLLLQMNYSIREWFISGSINWTWIFINDSW